MDISRYSKQDIWCIENLFCNKKETKKLYKLGIKDSFLDKEYLLSMSKEGFCVLIKIGNKTNLLLELNILANLDQDKEIKNINTEKKEMKLIFSN